MLGLGLIRNIGAYTYSQLIVRYTDTLLLDDLILFNNLLELLVAFNAVCKLDVTFDATPRGKLFDSEPKEGAAPRFESELA